MIEVVPRARSACGWVGPAVRVLVFSGCEAMLPGLTTTPIIMMSDPQLSQHDLAVLRRLAERKAAIAADPVNLERREAWYRHDAGAGGTGGTGGRPMVLAEFEAVDDDVRPIPDSAIECRDDFARGLERGLRVDIYRFDVLKDDHVIEPVVDLNWQTQATGYGVERTLHQADNRGRRAADRWDPALADLERDFQKLRPRTFSVDRETTLAEKARLEEIFDGVLPVRIRGNYWWTLGMTIVAINLIGLENLMLYMFDQAEALHALMGFLRDDHLAYAKWLEREGLLTLNNENDYIGSGAMGYTRDLPQPGGDDDHTRTLDQWALLESQETVGVGPGQFEEFIFPYQAAIAEQFGKLYYGCCEPVHTRWHVIKKMPNLSRVSVSPWADEPFMAEACGPKVVYSRKPKPTLISTERFDEDAIRADLRHTLTVAKGCRVELVMKDVHTLSNQPQRIARWVQLARETVDEVCG